MPTDTITADSELYRAGGSAFINANDRYTRNYKQLDQQFSEWQTVYREIADYVAIGRGRFADQGELSNRKTRANSKVINNTATDALHMLGAGLHGGLSSPARPWFQLKFSDPGLNKFSAYREWLDDCEEVLYGAFKRSNFYTIVHHAYEEVGGFGTGALFIDENPKTDILFTNFTAGDYRFSVRGDQYVHDFVRKFKMQACQMELEFGRENLSEKTKNVLQSNPYDWREIVHYVEPNPDFNPNRMDSFPWRSVYYEWAEPTKRLRETGYHEMPVVCPRWQALANEAYGWGPGLEALGLVKAIQRMEKQRFIASDKALDPPLGMPPSMNDRMLDLGPGGRNVFDEAGDRKPYALVDIDLRALEFYGLSIRGYEDRVRRMFFNELFLMIAQEQPAKMTATEVMARQEEKMLMLGPVIERLEYEFLDPIVERVFNILMRAGKLPPAPAELAQAEYKVEYISILAQAQKLINAQSLQGYLGVAGQVAQLDPNTIIKTDWDTYLDEVADTVSLPAKIMRSKEDVEAMRQAAADKQAEVEQLAKTAQTYENVKTLSETTTAGDSNALADVQKSMGA
jgi:hypothetical protein